MNSSPRDWTPYELNQLARAGLDSRQFSNEETTPVEYLTGQVDFCGRRLSVSPAALIPRIETEELVQHVVTALTQKQTGYTQPIEIAEIGTGTGALGLSISLALTQRTICHALTLSDISAEALDLARKNSQIVNDQTYLKKLQFVEGDLLENHKTLTTEIGGIKQPTTYDLIVANLPYIPSARIEQLDSSVREHEPHLALDGGPDGLTLITRLLEQAPPFLTPLGTVWLEIDDTHTLADFTHPAYHFILHPDQFGTHRFIEAHLRN